MAGVSEGSWSLVLSPPGAAVVPEKKEQWCVHGHSGCLTQSGSETGQELAQDESMDGAEEEACGRDLRKLRVGPVSYLQVWAGPGSGGSVLVTPEGRRNWDP